MYQLDNLLRQGLPPPLVVGKDTVVTLVVQSLQDSGVKDFSYLKMLLLAPIYLKSL
jgi:hypothetical protein